MDARQTSFRSLVSALRCIDDALLHIDRSACFCTDTQSGLVVFDNHVIQSFKDHDRIRVDVSMARHFAKLAMITSDKEINLSACDRLSAEGFLVNHCVYIGGEITRLTLNGKYFTLSISSVDS